MQREHDARRMGGHFFICVLTRQMKAIMIWSEVNLFQNKTAIVLSCQDPLKATQFIITCSAPMGGIGNLATILL